MARKRTNPNGANQYLVDPRQALFLSYYLDPISETFSNILQSGLRAGFEQSYAENISGMMPAWFKESIGELGMLQKAERNLNRFLDLDESEPNKLKVKADISKFVAERIGRKKYAPQAPPQGNTFNTIVFNGEQEQRIARRIIADNQSSEESLNRFPNSNESEI